MGITWGGGNKFLTTGYLICALLGKQPPCIDTDEASLGDVVEAADAPASVLGLEHLEFELQRLLSHSVEACAGTLAPAPTQNVWAEPLNTSQCSNNDIKQH
jgi:hypothetical protein